jgi:hypothetical protein
MGDPVPISEGGEGEAQFSYNTSHVIWKQMVNATLAMALQVNLAPCYKFHFLQTYLQYRIFYNIILGLGKMTNSQDRFPAIHVSMYSLQHAKKH